MAAGDRREVDAAAWAGRLVVVLVTFWTFVLTLVVAWVLDRAEVLSGAAFTWGLRALAAGATVAAFLLSPGLARRVSGRALAPLAVAAGLSGALALAYLFLALVIRVAP